MSDYMYFTGVSENLATFQIDSANPQNVLNVRIGLPWFDAINVASAETPAWIPALSETVNAIGLPIPIPAFQADLLRKAGIKIQDSEIEETP